MLKFSSVHFKNFKSFKDFSVRLDTHNILTGANNSGKSTIIDAFRTLAGAIRRANKRKAEFFDIEGRHVFGHNISPDLVPMTQSNVHTDYEEKLSEITFRFGSQKCLKLIFPKDGGCFLVPEVENARCDTPVKFKREFPIKLVVVPILSRLEEHEQLVEEGRVRRDLFTHRASRHFRSYWFHEKDRFERFRSLLQSTWDGMDVELPTISDPPTLSMFVKEGRIPREVFWSGSGFQIWCQILTYMSSIDKETMFVLDEPEIFLHPDLQRKLIIILKDSNCDVILATHSTEIISECDPSDVLIVDKGDRKAIRLRELDDLQKAFDSLGSLQNVTLTKLAKSRRVLFVESKNDFSLIQKFAQKAQFKDLSSGEGLVVVESGGYNQIEQIKALDWGIEKTLGRDLLIASVFDRDYRCSEEIAKEIEALSSKLECVHFHERKEIENYLLLPSCLQKAVEEAVKLRDARQGTQSENVPVVAELLEEITDSIRTECQSKYISSRVKFFERQKTSKDSSTITAQTIEDFDRKWGDLSNRLNIVPGKRVLRDLRRKIQKDLGVSLTTARILQFVRKSDIPEDLQQLFRKLQAFKCLSSN